MDFKNNVYHPRLGDTIIACIDEAWRHLDVSLCQLQPNITFTNSSYFECPSPKRLFHSENVPDEYPWCWVDGCTTGAIRFLLSGYCYALPGASNSYYHQLRHYRALMFGSAVGDVASRFSGAPVVTDSSDIDEQGLVLGFVDYTKGEMLYVRALDDLIAAG